MRIFVLVINYIFLGIWILILLSLMKFFNVSAFLWIFALISLIENFNVTPLLWGGAIIFIISIGTNIFYAHTTKPVDKEKEDLKK